MTEPNLELFNEIAKRINPSPWQQKVIFELIDEYNPWHKGVPTEEGWYVCKLKDCDIYETNYFTGSNWNEEFFEMWQPLLSKAGSIIK